MENLINRLRHMGVTLLIGFIAIIYIAFGFVYWQQAPQQREFNKQIAGLSLVLSRALTSAEELQAEYEEINRSLAPMTVKSALEKIVGIAEQSGIDIALDASELSIPPDVSKLNIPPASTSKVKVGGGSYQLLSFKNIKVQGDDDKVMAFISDLDSGKTLKTMVLRKVAIREEEVIVGDEKESITETVAIVDIDIYTKPEE